MTPEEQAYYDHCMRIKRGKEEEARRQLGWTDTHIGLYSLDSFLPPAHHSPGIAVTGNRPALRRQSQKLAQKRQRNQREVK